MKRIFQILPAIILFSAFVGFASAGPAKYGVQDQYSLSLQALKGKDGSTDLYVTTASKSDEVSPPQELKKIQLKSFTPQGKLISTKNLFNIASPEGAAKVLLKDAERYQSLKTKVHIKNGKTVKEEMLEGKTTVLLRPDLTVDEIQTLNVVPVNMPFPVTAVLKELNGDVEALVKASILDGTAVLNSIEGIIVDAGEQKQIVFLLTLSQAGIYNLKVDISGVEPGDYDLSNNERLFTVEAVEPRISVRHWSQYEYKPDFENHWQNSQVEYHNKGGSELFDANFLIPDLIEPRHVKLSLESETGNRKTIELELANYPDVEENSWSSYDENSQTYIWAEHTDSGTRLYVYSWPSHGSTQRNDHSFNHQSGDGYLGAEQSVAVHLDVTSENGTHYGGGYTIDLTPDHKEWDYIEDSQDPTHYWGYEFRYYGYNNGNTAW